MINTFKYGSFLAILIIGGCTTNKNITSNSIINSGDKKYQEIMAIPNLKGFLVSNTPNPVYLSDISQLDGYRYSWIYKTTVSSKKELKIVEFGAFDKTDNGWVLANYTGKPFTSNDFENWYNCPNYTINSKVSCADNNNWGASNQLTGKNKLSLWYFVGQDKYGKLFKAIGQIQEVEKFKNK